jgi:ferredoxin
MRHHGAGGRVDSGRTVKKQEKALSTYLALWYDEKMHFCFKEAIMAYKITDACINCGACEGECPSGAITEGDGVRVINADTCVSCGVCVSACPTEAIVEA